MAFNALEYLESGKVDFLDNFTLYDTEILKKRIRSSERKNEIIKGFLSLLITKRPYFCFDVIFDNDEFLEEAKYLLDKYYTYNSFKKEEFEAFLNSKLAPIFLEENFDLLIEKYADDIDFIFKYLFEHTNIHINLLKKLAYYPNLHIRYLFMKYLLINHPSKILMFYDDISKYLTSETYQIGEQLSMFIDNMEMEDVCDLAFIVLDKIGNVELWQKFKKFILSNYKYNNLAKALLEGRQKYHKDNNQVSDKRLIKEFSTDADRYFETSLNYRINILRGFSKYVSKELLDEYIKRINIFKRTGCKELDFQLSHIDYYNLGRKLEDYIDKYMDFSQDKTHEYLATGSTASCYRIGDYVFKLVQTKWSYEEEICPDLYLILPNLEEDFVRDEHGIVKAGLEVQKYLSKHAEGIPREILSMHAKELNRLGYYLSDSYGHGNERLLDSFEDSGNPNPPDWFKDYPVVLIDRDCIYKVGNKNPKQQPQYFSF